MPADAREFYDPAEDGPWRPPREIFADQGFAPVPPDQLDDRQLPGRLWELLYAAAGRRFFFSFTDHLSDRELYELLWRQWLDEPTADIPLEAETNTHISVSDLVPTWEDIWLRYYADEKDRESLGSTEPGFVCPPHEDPPYDRDRFLPTPPMPLGAQAGWLPEEEAASLGDFDGCSDEEEQENLGESEEPQPDGEVLESSFEAELRASEPENWRPPTKTLTEQNIPLLPPAELTDETLTPILWELLHNLALQGFYLSHTDHLSDRELYAELWHHGLREPALLPGRNHQGGWFHDFLGSWGEEETRIWLQFYASDSQRAQHAAEWPNDPLPPRAKRPFNRDWRLPKGPF